MDPLKVPTETPKNEPKAPEDTSAKVMDMLTDINENLTGMQERIDDIEGKVTAPPTTTPEQKEEPAWKPNTWDDIPKVAEEKAKDIVEKAFKQREEQANEANEAKRKETEKIEGEINSQVEALEKANRLPAIKDESDPNDPGRAARRELFGFAAKMQTTDLQAAAEALENLHKSGIHYDFKTNKYLKNAENPGKYTPIGSSSRSSGSFNEGPDYNTIHKARSLSELARLAGGTE